MRKIFIPLAAGAALLAFPAIAQSAPDEVIDHSAHAPGHSADAGKLTPATREQVRAGAEIRDSSGNRVGTVQSVEGDVAVVVKGGKLYNIPVGSIFHSATDAPGALVTELSQAEITARDAAAVEGGASTR